MASEYFLKIDGIQGDSRDAKHKDEIDVLSWSWGESQTGTRAFGGGGGAGKVAVQDFQFTAGVGRQSPLLLRAGARGDSIKQAVLTARQAGGKQQTEYLTFTFSDVLISSYQVGASGDATPVDAVSLNFSRIDMELKLTKADGSAGGSVKAGWDLKQNKAT